MRTGNIIKLGKHPASNVGVQIEYAFHNGYGASVIMTPFSYGGRRGLWELAVLRLGHLCYDTHITGDVKGHLTDSEVDEILNEIERLPPVEWV